MMSLSGWSSTETSVLGLLILRNSLMSGAEVLLLVAVSMIIGMTQLSLLCHPVPTPRLPFFQSLDWSTGHWGDHPTQRKMEPRGRKVLTYYLMNYYRPYCCCHCPKIEKNISLTKSEFWRVALEVSLINLLHVLEAGRRLSLCPWEVGLLARSQPQRQVKHQEPQVWSEDLVCELLSVTISQGAYARM